MRRKPIAKAQYRLVTVEVINNLDDSVSSGTALMMELVDMMVLETIAARRVGSTPT